jgi:hypothetical protein
MKSISLRALLAFAIGLALVGCANKPRPPLYQWEAFPKLQYEALLRTDAPPMEQVATMEVQAEKARANGAALPPGFRAHLGMLKLSAGDPDQARQLWLAEKAAFPESAPYMDQLLRRLEGSTKKDNPA